MAKFSQRIHLIIQKLDFFSVENFFCVTLFSLWVYVTNFHHNQHFRSSFIYTSAYSVSTKKKPVKVKCDASPRILLPKELISLWMTHSEPERKIFNNKKFTKKICVTGGSSSESNIQGLASHLPFKRFFYWY